MKVMLVRPKPHKNSLGLTDLMHCEPLDLEYVGTVIKSMGIDVLLVDLQVDKRDIKYYLKKYNPNIVLFTSYLIHVNIVKEYANIVKEYNAEIITGVGGIQSEVNPELFKHENIDYILGKNGIQNVKILIEATINNTKPNFLTNNDLQKENELPKVDRSLVDKYRKKYYYSYRMPCALLKTSFGCPFKCNFCFCTAITNYEYYVRDIERVIEEIKEVKEENIFIVDDNFLVDKERIKIFCELLEKNKIHKHYYISARADYIAENEDVIELISKHGFDTVFIGLESFKQKDLDNFNKKSSVEIAEKACEILKKYNIELHASAIVGEDWDKEDFKNFSSWLHTIKYRYINFMPLCPLPGTKLWDKYKDNLLFNVNEYEKFDFMHVMIKPSKLKLSQYYIEIIKIYFRVTANVKNLIYITRTCNLKVAIKTVYGLLKIICYYLKMSYKYKKIGE